MRESCMYGSERGARGNSRPYRTRRDFITLLGGAAAVWPLAARAQQREPMSRIGMLEGFAESNREGQERAAAFREGLKQLGWIEGRNIRIDIRWAAPGNVELISRLAKELVALQPDLILSSSMFRCTSTAAPLLQTQQCWRRR
jgi:putative tryptophan/tyrosine transport system substrate-binding protein